MYVPDILEVRSEKRYQQGSSVELKENLWKQITFSVAEPHSILHFC